MISKSLFIPVSLGSPNWLRRTWALFCRLRYILACLRAKAAWPFRLSFLADSLNTKCNFPNVLIHCVSSTCLSSNSSNYQSILAHALCHWTWLASQELVLILFWLGSVMTHVSSDWSPITLGSGSSSATPITPYILLYLLTNSSPTSTPTPLLIHIG